MKDWTKCYHCESEFRVITECDTDIPGFCPICGAATEEDEEWDEEEEDEDFD